MGKVGDLRRLARPKDHDKSAAGWLRRATLILQGPESTLRTLHAFDIATAPTGAKEGD